MSLNSRVSPSEIINDGEVLSVSQETAQALQAAPADRAAFPYDGFISHRHSPKQTLIVSAIQAALHKFAKPFWKLRALRLYRDESNLSARPDLWGQIVDALDRSRYLLLVASPETVASKWVKRETEHWLERRGERNLVILLTDGEIVWDDTRQRFDGARTSAVPSPLLARLKIEPLYVDLRWVGEPDAQLAMSNPRFADAVATIAAELHGKSKDELAGIDVREHRRWRLVRNTAVTAISLLAVGMTIAAYYWYEARNQALAEERVAQNRFVQLMVDHGKRDIGDGNLLGAWRWFAEAPVNDTFADRAAENAHRQRIASTRAQLPALDFNDVVGNDHVMARFSPDAALLLAAGGDGSMHTIDVAAHKIQNSGMERHR